MRPNRMRAGIAAGEVQVGTWVNMIRTPSVLTLLQAAGLDFARLDMEHTGASIEAVADMAAFDDLEAIAAMDGIDALTLGPSDLAQDLGISGSRDQGRILDERRDLVLAAARRHGKACAMLCATVEQARHWKAAGVDIIAYSSDSEVLHRGYAGAMKAIRD